ncbi:MAG: MDR family MFS transporter [Steroidobacter sp.]
MPDSNPSAADRRRTLTALAVVVLLSALDQTIVATAMPRIAEELQGLSTYAWVTTAHMLTSAASVPIFGRLNDLYARKPILVCGVVLFLAGSALCGLSGKFGTLPVLGDAMMQLVVFRALQGLGAGALIAVSFAILADMHPLRERRWLFGLVGSAFGLAIVIGPVIGGVLTDHGTVTLLGREVAGWRWVFYLNLPLGLIALFIILQHMPSPRKWGRKWGQSLIRRPEGERRETGEIGTVPISRWRVHLFRVRTFRISALVSFLMNMVFLGVVLFMPLYMQVVQGVTATQSGLALAPLMGGMIVSSIVSGRLVSRIGRYKPLLIGGGLMLIVGVLALTGIGSDTTPRDLVWRLALIGIGLGPAQTLFVGLIRNSAPSTGIGAATGMSHFSHQMGGAVGVAILGAFLTHALAAELPKHVPLLPGASDQRVDLAHAQSQAMDVERIRARVADALDRRYESVARAYAGDQAAVDEIAGDPRMPAQIKASVRDGGVRARAHREVIERADVIEQELRIGAEGRDRLMHNAELPAALRQQLANIPTRAFREPELMKNVAALFRDALLAKQDAIASAAIQRTLQRVHAALSIYANRLAEQIQRGMKIAFANSIAQMLERALWIVVAALIVILFIPEASLRSQATPQ